LLESLITVFLVMLVFGLVAELLISAFQVTRFEREKMQAAEAGQLALNRIQCEVRESCKVEIGGTDKELTLTKFNARYVDDSRLLTNRFRYLLKIHYYVDANSTLIRDVEDLFNGGTQTHVVADGIQGARFEWAPDSDNLVTTLSVSVRGQLRSISSEVCPQAFIP